MQADVLRQIHQGMKVYDSANHEIGKVDWVKFGEDDPSTPEVESAAPPIDTRDDSLITDIAKAFRTDELPEEIQDRLLEEGFVRINAAGIFAGDRYVLPSQISTVSGDALRLNVSKDELVKRH